MTTNATRLLIDHVNALHRRVPKRSTHAQLIRWHQEQHYRFSPNHWHEGVNLGPDQRPPGWCTGEGAVLR